MPAPDKIVLATANLGKVREITKILADLDVNVEVIAQTELGVKSPVEDGKTFVENALIKARHAATETGLPAIADDSGLVVEALGGQPGVHSARYSGDGATDDSNIDKLLVEMSSVPADQRGAAFHCCACYVTPDDTASLVAEGRWEGKITTERRGTDGFGYDPVFYDPEAGRTAAELGPEQKNARSHRGTALTALAEMMRQQFM